MITFGYLLVDARKPKRYVAYRAALANRDHDATSRQSAMSATEPKPGRFGNGQSRVGPRPLSPAHQCRILHSQPRLQPLGLLRSDQRGRLHDHDSGHIQQTGRDAQPQLTGTRHHNGPIEIDSELRRRLQPEIRDSYEGSPLSSL
jgi:hypothetical protein